MEYKHMYGKESILPDDVIMSIKTEPIGEPEVIIEQQESDIATCEKKIDALRAFMEQRLNHIQVQIDVIMEAQEEQNMLLRSFLDSQQDMRSKFPIQTCKRLKEINDDITPENRKSYINTVKALLKPNGIKKNLKYLLSIDIVNEYNVDGVHGKLCLKDLRNFYDVVIDSIEVTASTPSADQQLREAIRLAKKRYLKSKSVSRARV
ncbi:uncharacterized protein ACRADG_004342 [Cochliomyia hominivorax]